MPQDAYWRIFAEEVPADIGVDLSPQQISDLTDALTGAHENYGLHSGRDVADANWRAAHDREVEARGAAKVLAFVQEKLAEINRGPARMFDVMNDRQRFAMHELFQAREFLQKQGVSA